MILTLRYAAARGGCAAAGRLAAGFHSTPVLERKRRSHWSGSGFSRSKRFNYNGCSARKFDPRMLTMHDISDYAEYLFESWRGEPNQSNPSLDDDTPGYRRQNHSNGGRKHTFGSHEQGWGSYRGKGKRRVSFWSSDDDDFCSNGGRKHTFGSHEQEWGSHRGKGKKRVDFCSSDDDDVENIFRSSFGGEQCYYWSFNDSDDFHSGHANHRSSWNSRYQSENGTGTQKSDLTSERLTLGLSASGPLKLEEVKNAYRACALRWHPDRHQGSSKAAAEENFKHCSAAYTQLCDRLAMN